jgi:hypothetical protein
MPTIGIRAISLRASSLKGIERQFHTFFKWDSSNVNAFFSMFGPTAIARYKTQCTYDEGVASCARDFLYVGNVRNQIAHDNYLGFPLNDTPAEMLAKVESAAKFVDCIDSILAR